MTRMLLLASTLLLGTALAFGQRGATTPPSDTGIGNSNLSPNSDVSNNPSFSPDQNQAITNDRGSSTGDKYPNPAFAGNSSNKTGSASQSQGAVGATGSASATAGRRLPQGAGTSASQTAGQSKAGLAQRGKAKSRKLTVHRKHKQANVSKQSGRTSIPPEQGPSTTSAPGPSTGVPGAKLPQGGNGNYSGTSASSSGPGR